MNRGGPRGHPYRGTWRSGNPQERFNNPRQNPFYDIPRNGPGPAFRRYDGNSIPNAHGNTRVQQQAAYGNNREYNERFDHRSRGRFVRGSTFHVNPRMLEPRMRTPRPGPDDLAMDDFSDCMMSFDSPFDGQGHASRGQGHFVPSRGEVAAQAMMDRNSMVAQIDAEIHRLDAAFSNYARRFQEKKSMLEHERLRNRKEQDKVKRRKKSKSRSPKKSPKPEKRKDKDPSATASKESKKSEEKNKEDDKPAEKAAQKEAELEEGEISGASTEKKAKSVEDLVEIVTKVKQSVDEMVCSEMDAMTEISEEAMTEKVEESKPEKAESSTSNLTAPVLSEKKSRSQRKKSKSPKKRNQKDEDWEKKQAEKKEREAKEKALVSLRKIKESEKLFEEKERQIDGKEMKDSASALSILDLSTASKPAKSTAVEEGGTRDVDESGRSGVEHEAQTKGEENQQPNMDAPQFRVHQEAPTESDEVSSEMGVEICELDYSFRRMQMELRHEVTMVTNDVMTSLEKQLSRVSADSEVDNIIQQECETVGKDLDQVLLNEKVENEEIRKVKITKHSPVTSYGGLQPLSLTPKRKEPEDKPKPGQQIQVVIGRRKEQQKRSPIQSVLREIQKETQKDFDTAMYSQKPLFSEWSSSAYQRATEGTKDCFPAADIVCHDSLAGLTDELNVELAAACGVKDSDWRLNMPKVDGRDTPCAFLPREARDLIIESLVDDPGISPYNSDDSDFDLDTQDEGSDDSDGSRARNSKVAAIVKSILRKDTRETLKRGTKKDEKKKLSPETDGKSTEKKGEEEKEKRVPFNIPLPPEPRRTLKDIMIDEAKKKAHKKKKHKSKSKDSKSDDSKRTHGSSQYGTLPSEYLSTLQRWAASYALHMNLQQCASFWNSPYRPPKAEGSSAREKVVPDDVHPPGVPYEREEPSTSYSRLPADIEPYPQYPSTWHETEPTYVIAEPEYEEFVPVSLEPHQTMTHFDDAHPYEYQEVEILPGPYQGGAAVPHDVQQDLHPPGVPHHEPPVVLFRPDVPPPTAQGFEPTFTTPSTARIVTDMSSDTPKFQMKYQRLTKRGLLGDGPSPSTSSVFQTPTTATAQATTDNAAPDLNDPPTTSEQPIIGPAAMPAHVPDEDPNKDMFEASEPGHISVSVSSKNVSIPAQNENAEGKENQNGSKMDQVREDHAGTAYISVHRHQSKGNEEITISVTAVTEVETGKKANEPMEVDTSLFGRKKVDDPVAMETDAVKSRYGDVSLKEMYDMFTAESRIDQVPSPNMGDEDEPDAPPFEAETSKSESKATGDAEKRNDERKDTLETNHKEGQAHTAQQIPKTPEKTLKTTKTQTESSPVQKLKSPKIVFFKKQKSIERSNKFDLEGSAIVKNTSESSPVVQSNLDGIKAVRGVIERSTTAESTELCHDIKDCAPIDAATKSKLVPRDADASRPAKAEFGADAPVGNGSGADGIPVVRSVESIFSGVCANLLMMRSRSERIPGICDEENRELDAKESNKAEEKKTVDEPESKSSVGEEVSELNDDDQAMTGMEDTEMKLVQEEPTNADDTEVKKASKTIEPEKADLKDQAESIRFVKEDVVEMKGTTEEMIMESEMEEAERTAEIKVGEVASKPFVEELVVVEETKRDIGGEMTEESDLVTKPDYMAEAEQSNMLELHEKLTDKSEVHDEEVRQDDVTNPSGITPRTSIESKTAITEVVKAKKYSKLVEQLAKAIEEARMAEEAGMDESKMEEDDEDTVSDISKVANDVEQKEESSEDRDHEKEQEVATEAAKQPIVDVHAEINKTELLLESKISEETITSEEVESLPEEMKEDMVGSVVPEALFQMAEESVSVQVLEDRYQLVDEWRASDSSEEGAKIKNGSILAEDVNMAEGLETVEDSQVVKSADNIVVESISATKGIPVSGYYKSGINKQILQKQGSANQSDGCSTIPDSDYVNLQNETSVQSECGEIAKEPKINIDERSGDQTEYESFDLQITAANLTAISQEMIPQTSTDKSPKPTTEPPNLCDRSDINEKTRTDKESAVGIPTRPSAGDVTAGEFELTGEFESSSRVAKGSPVTTGSNGGARANSNSGLEPVSSEEEMDTKLDQNTVEKEVECATSLVTEKFENLCFGKTVDNAPGIPDTVFRPLVERISAIVAKSKTGDSHSEKVTPSTAVERRNNCEDTDLKSSGEPPIEIVDKTLPSSFLPLPKPKLDTSQSDGRDSSFDNSSDLVQLQYNASWWEPKYSSSCDSSPDKRTRPSSHPKNPIVSRWDSEVPKRRANSEDRSFAVSQTLSRVISSSFTPLHQSDELKNTSTHEEMDIEQSDVTEKSDLSFDNAEIPSAVNTSLSQEESDIEMRLTENANYWADESESEDSLRKKALESLKSKHDSATTMMVDNNTIIKESVPGHDAAVSMDTDPQVELRSMTTKDEDIIDPKVDTRDASELSREEMVYPPTVENVSCGEGVEFPVVEPELEDTNDENAGNGAAASPNETLNVQPRDVEISTPGPSTSATVLSRRSSEPPPKKSQNIFDVLSRVTEPLEASSSDHAEVVSLSDILHRQKSKNESAALTTLQLLDDWKSGKKADHVPKEPAKTPDIMPTTPGLIWPVFNPTGFRIPKKKSASQAQGPVPPLRRVSSDGDATRNLVFDQHGAATKNAESSSHEKSAKNAECSADNVGNASEPVVMDSDDIAMAETAENVPSAAEKDASSCSKKTAEDTVVTEEKDGRLEAVAEDADFPVDEEDEDEDEDDLPAFTKVATGKSKPPRAVASKNPSLVTPTKCGEPPTPTESPVINKLFTPSKPASTDLFSLEALHAEKKEMLSDAGQLYCKQEAESKETIRKGGFRQIIEECENEQEVALHEDQEEELKKLVNEETTIQTWPPGDDRFETERRVSYFDSALSLAQCGFTQGTSRVDKYLATSDADQLKSMIKGDILSIAFKKISCKEAFLLWLFNIVSIHEEEDVVRDAHRLLYHILADCGMSWVPSVPDVTRVFLNYGATLQSLYPPECQLAFTEADLALLAPTAGSSAEKGAREERSDKNFMQLNLQCVIQSISICAQKCSHLYATNDLKHLIVLVCGVAIDKQVLKGVVRYDLEVCLQELMEKFDEAEWTDVMYDLCLLLPRVTSHHHNRLQLAKLMPPTKRGRQIQRCLSYSLLLASMPDARAADDVTTAAGDVTSSSGEESARRVPEKEEIAEFRVSSLIHVMNELLRQPVTPGSYYLLSSLVQLVDLAVGNEALPKKERPSLVSMENYLRQLTSCVRDNCHNLDTSTIKDLIQRTISKWTFLLRDMGKTQKTLFDHYSRGESSSRKSLEEEKEEKSDRDQLLAEVMAEAMEEEED